MRTAQSHRVPFHTTPTPTRSNTHASDTTFKPGSGSVDSPTEQKTASSDDGVLHVHHAHRLCLHVAFGEHPGRAGLACAPNDVVACISSFTRARLHGDLQQQQQQQQPDQTITVAPTVSAVGCENECTAEGGQPTTPVSHDKSDSVWVLRSAVFRLDVCVCVCVRI